MLTDRHDEASRFSQFCERAKNADLGLYRVELEPAILCVRGSGHYTQL